MKVLLVNDYSTPSGGAEVSMLRIRDMLRRGGHEARLFSSDVAERGLSPEADDTCFGTAGSFRTLLQTANPWAALRLQKVVREFRPDVIHVKIFLTQLSPLIQLVLKHTPSLYHVAWYRPICPTGLKMLPGGEICHDRPGLVCHRQGCVPLRDMIPVMTQMHLFRRWLGCFRLIAANSESVKQRLASEGISPVEVIYYGVPERDFRPPLSDPPSVVFAGRLVPEKGVDVLLRAFATVLARIPEAKLWIAGDGPERSRLQALTAALSIGNNVTFLGHLRKNDMEKIFAGAWLQAVPSRWEEPYGIVAAEAMMRGTAVVASASGGLTEIVIDGETGMLIPSGNTESLSRAMTRVLGDRNLAESWGRTGRDRALERFSETVFLGRLMELYKKAIRS